MNKSDDTMKRIRLIARDVFSENGYTTTSTKTVAEKANVSEALIFKYYGNKQGLLDAVLFDTMSIFKSTSLPEIDFWVNQDLPAKERILKIFANRLDFLERHQKELSIIVHQAYSNDKLLLFLKSIFLDQIRIVLMDLLKTGQNSDLEVKDINLEIRCELLESLFYNLLLKGVIFKEKISIKYLNEKLDIILKGLYYE